MKELHKDWQSLARDLLLIVCIAGTVGIAAKYVSFFNNWVLVPNVPKYFRQHLPNIFHLRRLPLKQIKNA
jgi:hypothetical protein